MGQNIFSGLVKTCQNIIRFPHIQLERFHIQFFFHTPSNKKKQDNKDSCHTAEMLAPMWPTAQTQCPGWEWRGGPRACVESRRCMSYKCFRNLQFFVFDDWVVTFSLYIYIYILYTWSILIYTYTSLSGCLGVRRSDQVVGKSVLPGEPDRMVLVVPVLYIDQLLSICQVDVGAWMALRHSRTWGYVK